MKNPGVIIVADDGGLTSQIDEQLAHLATINAIDAISVMTVRLPAYVSQPLVRLPSCQKHIHLCLTFGAPAAIENWRALNLLTKDNLFKLSFATLLFIELLPKNMPYKVKFRMAVEKEFKAQLGLFTKHYGKPSGADSHQHIQVFPTVWNAMVKNFGSNDTILRWPAEPFSFRKQFLAAFNNPTGAFKSVVLTVLTRLFMTKYLPFESYRMISGLSQRPKMLDSNIVPKGVIFVCHPGPGTPPNLPDRRLDSFLSHSERKRELEILMARKNR